jgi:hypothetical protein
MNKLTVLLLLTLTACGKSSTPLPVYNSTVTTATDEVKRIVDEENAKRLLTSTLPLTPGLTCSLHTNLSTSLTAFPVSLPTATLSYGYVGVFNQPDTSSTGINVLPSSIRSLYTQWYAIRCSGSIIITESKYYQYALTSDDASLLYIDNVKVVDNDGNHGSTTKYGMRALTVGVHTFRLDYMQGPAGNQSLILSDQLGNVVPSNVFYR